MDFFSAEDQVKKGPFPDPRDPRFVLVLTLLTLLVLGWFIWVLANWPQSVVFR